MADDAGKRVSWWQTLPGVLTGIAAVLTAFGGLLAVLVQNGLLFKHGGAAPPATITSNSSAPAASGHGALPADTASHAAKPQAESGDGPSAQAGHVRYTLISVTQDPNPGSQPPSKLVHFTLEATDVAGISDYVDRQTIRLRSDHAELTPENSVDVALYEHASATVEAVFVVKSSVKQVDLLLGRSGDAVATMPVNLQQLGGS